ncbi:MAG: type II secretion system protein [Planctomycetes bacterium]|nr:type II secretion system protein [Planctomycetota bacterium]
MMRSQRPQSGFTLIEVMVVIAILSLLITALWPSISRALGASEETETQARMMELRAAIEEFQREYGFYPSDDFQNFGDEIEIKAKPDGVNSGVESLVMFLCWKPNARMDLTDNEDWLDNTDGDENSVEIPGLQRTAKMEVVDAWGTPFAYFTSQNYTKQQQIRLGGDGAGDDVIAKAYKNPNGKGFVGPRKFQLISAGPDREFNTEDDLVYPAVPRD